MDSIAVDGRYSNELISALMMPNAPAKVIPPSPSPSHLHLHPHLHPHLPFRCGCRQSQDQFQVADSHWCRFLIVWSVGCNWRLFLGQQTQHIQSDGCCTSHLCIWSNILNSSHQWTKAITINNCCFDFPCQPFQYICFLVLFILDLKLSQRKQCDNYGDTTIWFMNLFSDRNEYIILSHHVINWISSYHHYICTSTTNTAKAASSSPKQYGFENALTYN